jgi:hypothetical protein
MHRRVWGALALVLPLLFVIAVLSHPRDPVDAAPVRLAPPATGGAQP